MTRLQEFFKDKKIRNRDINKSHFLVQQAIETLKASLLENFGCMAYFTMLNMVALPIQKGERHTAKEGCWEIDFLIEADIAGDIVRQTTAYGPKILACITFSSFVDPHRKPETYRGIVIRFWSPQTIVVHLQGCSIGNKTVGYVSTATTERLAAGVTDHFNQYRLSQINEAQPAQA